MLTARVIQRCDRCGADGPACRTVRRLLEAAATNAAAWAARRGERLPDAELVLDCRCFWPRGRRCRG